MYKRFFTRALNYPKLIIFVTVIVIFLSLWTAKMGLFEDGHLNIDTSSRPFVEEKSVYDSDLDTENRFKLDSRSFFLGVACRRLCYWSSVQNRV